jgi:tetratricopeptide (TPR) repeat protein
MPLPAAKFFEDEVLGDSWALLPISLIVLGTLATLFFGWPPQHLWTPPINHNELFDNWQFNYPPPGQTLFPYHLPPVAALPGLLGAQLDTSRLSALHGPTSAVAAKAYVDWALDAQRDGGKGWHYSVVLWIHAPTVTDVTTQYMELAYRLGLRSASETGPEITTRVLTWLYKQPSYLIVFDRCDLKWNTTAPLDPFIPRHHNEDRTDGASFKKQMGHVLFVGGLDLLKGERGGLYIPTLFPLEQEAMDYVAASCDKNCGELVTDAMHGRVWGLGDLLLLKGGIQATGTPDALPLLRDTSVGQWALGRLPEGAEGTLCRTLLKLLTMVGKAPIPSALLQAYASLSGTPPAALTSALRTLEKSWLVATATRESNFGEQVETVLCAPAVQKAMRATLDPEETIATALDVIAAVALTGEWPGAESIREVPLRSPQYMWSDDTADDTQDGLSLHQRHWGRQYYTFGHFGTYHVQEEAGNAIRDNRRHALLRATLYLATITAAARSISAALQQTGIDAKAVLGLAMARNTGDVRFVLEMLGQAGHYLLGVHEDASAAAKVFKTRLALAKIIDGFSAVTHDELTLAERDMGVALLAQGRIGNAQKTLTRALELGQTRTGAHMSVAIITSELGDAYLQAKDLNKAREFYEQAIVIGSSIDKQSLCMAPLYHKLARLFEQKDMYTEQLKTDDAAFTLEREVLGNDHYTVSYRLDHISRGLEKINRISDALSFRTTSLQVTKDAFDNLHPLLVSKLTGLAQTLMQVSRGRKGKQALRHFEQALEMEVEAAGEVHPRVFERLSDLGHHHHGMGAYDKALSYFHKRFKYEAVLKGRKDPGVMELEKKVLELYYYVKKVKEEKEKAEAAAAAAEEDE